MTRGGRGGARRVPVAVCDFDNARLLVVDVDVEVDVVAPDVLCSLAAIRQEEHHTGAEATHLAVRAPLRVRHTPAGIPLRRPRASPLPHRSADEAQKLHHE